MREHSLLSVLSQIGEYYGKYLGSHTKKSRYATLEMQFPLYTYIYVKYYLSLLDTFPIYISIRLALIYKAFSIFNKFDAMVSFR